MSKIKELSSVALDEYFSLDAHIAIKKGPLKLAQIQYHYWAPRQFRIPHPISSTIM